LSYFDKPVGRLGTASLKWDKYKRKDIIPLWVADMDFRSPPAVIQALKSRVDHGVFGYTIVPDELVETVVSMLAKEYMWLVEPEWIVWLPGLVTGLNITCRCVGEKSDDVLLSVPIYPPFLTAPQLSGKNLVTTALIEEGGRYIFDFDGLENDVTSRTRLFLHCNPHNPVGRVFSEEELKRLAWICDKHDVIICSDEIHCGLVLDTDKKHIPIATLGEDIARRTVTLMAPSKTFNIPGLGCSFAVIAERSLRKSFIRVMEGIVPHVNALGYTAALAAYRDSKSWHSELLDYLRENRDLVSKSIQDMPGLSMNHVEATYLAWISTKEAGIEEPAVFFETAGVGLSDGTYFGTPGFVRLNFGCPRSLLIEALDRMGHSLQHGRNEISRR
jgi:cystathionine beta-lyase